MSLVCNGRSKYLATPVNTVAVASIAAGVIAPRVAFSYGVPGPIGGLTAILISVAWFLTGAALTLCRTSDPRTAAGTTLLHWDVLIGAPAILLLGALRRFVDGTA